MEETLQWTVAQVKLSKGAESDIPYEPITTHRSRSLLLARRLLLRLGALARRSGRGN
jgi:hypothetical protein